MSEVWNFQAHAGNDWLSHVVSIILMSFSFMAKLKEGGSTQQNLYVCLLIDWNLFSIDLKFFFLTKRFYPATDLTQNSPPPLLLHY